MKKSKLIQPFLKWAGGKRQLLHEIEKYIPKAKIRTFYEPFFGGGAVVFSAQPKNAVINDINSELVNAYKVVRDNVEELIADLSKHKNEKDYYYQMRELDRQEEYKNLNDVERASRLIYLNKTCYNGLFRVNSQGQFNVPFGDYKSPNIVNEFVLRAVNSYLRDNNVEIFNTDFATAVANAGQGDFVYFDPPYDPVSDTSSFTGYSLDGFGREQQIRLRDTFAQLSERGCKVLLSNSATEFIIDLYKDFNLITVEANRTINSIATSRGKVDEVLVMNYGIK